MENYYKPGSHNVICDLCGKKWKREQIKKTWNGFMACPNDWYPKPKNELPRHVIVDGRPVKDSREQHLNYLVSQITITLWTDTLLKWNTPTWKWDDDPSQIIGLLYLAGQFIQT